MVGVAVFSSMSNKRGHLLGLFWLVVGLGVGLVPPVTFGRGEGLSWCWRKTLRRSSFAGSARGVEVDEEGFDLDWEVNGREEEVFWWVYPSGRAVGWVVTGVDVSCCEDCVVCFQKLMNSPEDGVGFCVLTPSSPPVLDDTCVVTKDLYAWNRMGAESCANEELHTQCFGPTNVSPS